MQLMGKFGTYSRFIDQNSGYTLEVTRDLDLLAMQLKSLSTADAAVVDEIISISLDGRRFQGDTVFIDRPISETFHYYKIFYFF